LAVFVSLQAGHGCFSRHRNRLARQQALAL
jgi:hypothetical protein